MVWTVLAVLLMIFLLCWGPKLSIGVYAILLIFAFLFVLVGLFKGAWRR